MKTLAKHFQAVDFSTNPYSETSQKPICTFFGRINNVGLIDLLFGSSSRATQVYNKDIERAVPALIAKADRIQINKYYVLIERQLKEFRSAQESFFHGLAVVTPTCANTIERLREKYDGEITRAINAFSPST
jgi:hypothetical protein